MLIWFILKLIILFTLSFTACFFCGALLLRSTNRLRHYPLSLRIAVSYGLGISLHLFLYDLLGQWIRPALASIYTITVMIILGCLGIIVMRTAILTYSKKICSKNFFRVIFTPPHITITRC